MDTLEFKIVFYNSLAHAFNYPDEELAKLLSSGEFTENLLKVSPENLKADLSALLIYCQKDKDEILIELQRDYTWMFFASKPRIAYLFGSAYKEGKLYQDSTFKIARLYHETGLRIKDAFKLPPDHIALELEFMAYLAFNEGKALKDANKKNLTYAIEMQEHVLKDYLSPLAVNIGKRIIDKARTEFYRIMGRLLLSIFQNNNKQKEMRR